MDKTEIGLPDQQKHFVNLLEDAYTALAEVETSVDELKLELEYHHERLGSLLILMIRMTIIWSS